MLVEELKQHIQETQQLPTLPIMAQQIMHAANNDEGSFKALSAIVAQDPSTSMKLLGLANAALYGQQSQVSSVHRAVTVVGTDMLKRLALCAFVKAAWKHSVRHEHFWKHSIAVAFGTSFLSENYADVSGDDAFCVGLLHDVDMLVLESILPKAYEEVEQRIAVTDSRLEAEQHLLGVDHTQAGAWFAERWKLPPTLIDGIASHHCESEDSISSMIRVAERAALGMDLGLHGELDEEPLEGQSEVETYLRSKAFEIDAFFSVEPKKAA